MIQPENLIGKNVRKIGRAAAMCWIHFGRPVEIESRGRKRIVGEFALDLDCPWRIRNSSGGIELGSADMFVPASGHALDEDFDWDIQGNNLFDEKAKLLFPEGSQIVVTSAGLGSKYPYLMNCLYQGRLERDDIPPTRKELRLAFRDAEELRHSIEIVS